MSNKKRCRVLILAPHPDDECLMAPLALWLKKMSLERGFSIEVTAVAMSLGSDLSRQLERKREFKHACKKLGFKSIIAGISQKGLSSLRNKKVDASDVLWTKHFVKKYAPTLVIAPHAKDLHPVHEGVFRLLKKVVSEDKTLSCFVATTEFWFAQRRPNLMLIIDHKMSLVVQDALACHQGEMQRFPYHDYWSAFVKDSFRRGQEMLGGFGQVQKIKSASSVLITLGKVSRGKLQFSRQKKVLTTAFDFDDDFYRKFCDLK